VNGSALLLLLLAAVPGPPPVPEPPAAVRPEAPEARLRVARVVLDLPPGEAEGPLRDKVTVEEGALLSRRAVRESVAALYASGRFGNVVASLEPAAGEGAVVVTFTCLPRRDVRRVSFVDPAGRALEQEWLAPAAALEPGTELWRGRLAEAAERVREACARHGYRQARVTASAEGEVKALVRVEVALGPPTRVVALSLGPGGREAALGAGLATRPGAPLDLELLESDVRALRARLRKEGYLRSRVGQPVVAVEGERARVEIPIEKGPRVLVRFTGAAAFPADELKGELKLEEEQALDPPAVAAAAERVRAFYVSQGYAEARVTSSELSFGPELVLLFAVWEGRRYRVAQVSFPGALARSPRWLEERLDEALAELAPPEKGGLRAEAEILVKASGSSARVASRPAADPRFVYDPSRWERAAQRLVETYRDEGFLEATLGGLRATLDERSGEIAVEVRLREGVETRVRAILYEGVRALSAEDLAREARLAAGDALAIGAVEATRAALLGLYAQRGYLYARVRETEEFSPDRALATVRFLVEEGPQVRVKGIVVKGARRTREYVVLGALELKAGDVYTPELAARSQAELLRLGVFRSVGLHLSDPDLPEPEKDLEVELSEQPYQTLAEGVGFSIANGPRAFVELSRPNLFGRALELTARAKVNYPIPALRVDQASLEAKPPLDRVEGHGEVSLHDPRLTLFGFGSGVRFTAIAERLHRPAYDLSRGSGLLGFDAPLAPRVSLSLQYELEVDHILKSEAAQVLTLADVEALRFPEGVTTLQSVRPVLVLDFRDSTVHPRRGFLASSTLEYAHSIATSLLFGLVHGSDTYTNMLKGSAALTGYLPIAEQGTLVLSLQGGRILPIGASQTILPKRFFLGGASTMRGYGEDEMVPEDVRPAYLQEVAACASSLSGLACSQVARQLQSGQTLISEGGQAFVVAKTELRFGVYHSLEGSLFTDLGNLWLDPSRFTLADLRLNFGAGLRFLTPIGPAVLDLGFNASPDGRLGEAVLAPHFSIGLF